MFRNHIARNALILSLVIQASLPVLAQPGTLDPSFAPTGAFDANPRSVAVQADGRVVIGGFFTTYDGNAAGHIIRMNADGSVDPAFITGTGFNNSVLGMVLQPDGKLLVHGSFNSYNGTFLGRGLVRLETDGSIDAGFVPPTFSGAVVNALALRSDGRIHVAVNVSTGGQQGVFRLMADGTLDGTFNTAGAFNAVVLSLALFADDRILATGAFSTVHGQPRAGSCVLDPSGSLNTTFDPGTGTQPNASAVVTDVLDGTKPVLGGNFNTYNTQPMVRLAVLEGDGTPVVGFNGGTGPDNSLLFVRSLAAGKIMIGGNLQAYNGTPVGHICRLGSDGQVDPGFTATANSWVGDMDLDGTDALYIVGAFSMVNGMARPGVAKLSNCTPTTWFADTDGDGFGDATSTLAACSAPVGFVANDDDCDDTDEDISPNTIWYVDADGDEAGDPNNTIMACEQPPGTSEDSNDCDDSDPAIAPSNNCDDNDPYTTGDIMRPYPECGCRGKQLIIAASVLLQGPYESSTGLMRDDLRQAGLIPLQEPYTGLGYLPAGGSVAGGDMTTPAVLAVSGPDAIVDWVVLEMRAQADPQLRITTRYALLQRDGDIVEPDGVSPVRMPTAPGHYRLAVLQRNHMGVVELGQTGNGSYYEIENRDMSSATMQVYGDSPRTPLDGVMLLRTGDTSFNDEVLYVGFGNDRDPILTRIGGSIPTATVGGYFLEDVNMDGVVKYVGSNNDRDAILITIGGSIPTAMRPHVYFFPTY